MINRKWIQSLGLFAIVIGVLLSSILLARSAFQPTPTPPTSTLTATDTPTQSYPAPTLVSPASGATIMGEELTNFSWHWDGALQEGEKFDLRIWRSGKPCSSVSMQRKYNVLLDTPPDGFGHYLWQVAVVRINESGKVILSESLIWSFDWNDVPPTSTATSTPTQTPRPTTTPTHTATPLPHTPRPIATPTPTVTVTRTPRSTTAPPTHTATPQLTSPIALTIYLRDTITEAGFAALSGDQVNGGMIYEEGKFVYGEAAVQIGAMTYHFDKPEVEPGEPEQLPDPWRVEFEFAKELVARTGNQAGFTPKKAQFWVGTLDGDSAVGEKSPYSLTMKLYEGNELRESVQVFFTVADAPGGEEGGPGGTPAKPPPP